MDDILYWIVYLWVETTLVPEKTNQACLNVIKEYIES